MKDKIGVSQFQVELEINDKKSSDEEIYIKINETLTKLLGFIT